jgi:hypothetical protein
VVAFTHVYRDPGAGSITLIDMVYSENSAKGPENRAKMPSFGLCRYSLYSTKGPEIGPKSPFPAFVGTVYTLLYVQDA